MRTLKNVWNSIVVLIIVGIIITAFSRGGNNSLVKEITDGGGMDAGSRGGDNSLVKEITDGGSMDAGSRGGDNSLVKEIKAGNRIVKFGNYFINDDTTKEPIEWRVLEVSNDRALLITKDEIDWKPYNNEWRDITWENCTLRRWLNHEFIYQAFNKEEQNEIILTNISNPNNAMLGTNGGNNTKDKIFLLSVDEAEKYFKDDKDRECKPTKYTEKQGASSYFQRHLDSCDWWLRSPGDFPDYAAIVRDKGNIYDFGHEVYNDIAAVRPALWINL